MSKVDDKATLPLRRAVANLLRLASWNVKDAELLLVGRNPEIAPLLIAAAVHRLMEAVAGTEHGWPVAAKDNDLDQIPDDNALKPGLARIVRARREIIESGQWQERRNRIAVWFGATRSRMAFSPM